MSAYAKPLPVPDADSAPYWDGCKAHQLLLQRCDHCSVFRFPASPTCPNCSSELATWVRSSGQGKVFSWIVVRHPVPADVYGADVPYTIALIELEEGVRMASNVLGCEPEAVYAGMPVSVHFEDVTPEISLPKFKPLE